MGWFRTGWQLASVGLLSITVLRAADAPAPAAGPVATAPAPASAPAQTNTQQLRAFRTELLKRIAAKEIDWVFGPMMVPSELIELARRNQLQTERVRFMRQEPLDTLLTAIKAMTDEDLTVAEDAVSLSVRLRIATPGEAPAYFNFYKIAGRWRLAINGSATAKLPLELAEPAPAPAQAPTGPAQTNREQLLAVMDEAIKRLDANDAAWVFDHLMDRTSRTALLQQTDRAGILQQLSKKGRLQRMAAAMKAARAVPFVLGEDAITLVVDLPKPADPAAAPLQDYVTFFKVDGEWHVGG